MGGVYFHDVPTETPSSQMGNLASKKKETFGGAVDALYVDPRGIGDPAALRSGDGFVGSTQTALLQGDTSRIARLGPRVATPLKAAQVTQSLAERNAAGVRNTAPVFVTTREVSSDYAAKTDWRPVPYQSADVLANIQQVSRQPFLRDVRMQEAAYETMRQSELLLQIAQGSVKPQSLLGQVGAQ